MQKTGHIRIIGGQWRSRRVRCVAAAGLRPSPDAVRETLFNWLPGQLRHTICLDLFAGSGAFGFEAASRGAPKVIMVESNPRAVRMLRVNRAALQGGAVEIFPGTVERFLRRNGTVNANTDDTDGNDGFDLVFLDPPFHSRAIGATCENLQARGFLNPRALVYIESPPDPAPLPLPADWHIIREKRRGGVQSTLIQT